MIIIWIIVAILIFSFVIIIHEFGHFFAARKLEVKVLEFWLGIPPKAKELFTDKHWTKYTLNWLPLWWFVRLNWEDSSEKDPLDKTKFYNKNYLEKSTILLAWVFMNFLLASIIFSILFFIWIKPLWINDQIPTNLNSKIIPTYSQSLKEWILIKNSWILLNPVVGSIAEQNWIKNWDILIKINNIKVNNTQEVINITSKNKDKEIKLKIERSINKSKKETRNISIKTDSKWKIWIYISDNIYINNNFEYKYWFLNSMKYWFTETYIQSILTIKWLWILWKKIFSPENTTDRQEALDQMSWPIWIVDFVSNSIWAWIIFLLIITAIISVSLGIFNLLPIPALDWWRFFILTINTIIKKIFWDKKNIDNIENILHIIFFITLIALSILIWYNDIIKIINR